MIVVKQPASRDDRTYLAYRTTMIGVRTALYRYGVALLATVIAVLVRWLLNPWLGAELPLATLFAAVAVAAWYGGYGPALLVILLGYLAANYLFIEPQGMLFLQQPAHIIGFLIYLGSCTVIMGFGAGMRAAERRAQATTRELLERQAQLEGQIRERKQAEQERAASLAKEQASRHQAEAAGAQLRERLEELETLLDILPVGVWIGNAQCDRIIGNHAAYEILGLPFGSNASITSEAANRPPLAHLKFFIDAREAAPEQLPMHRVARTGTPCKQVQYDVIRPDGELRSVYGSAAPLFDETGKVRAVIGAQTDITQRKQMETALREADRRKDEFLATLAHELRNPLSPIRSALSVLRLEGPQDSALVRARDMIDRQVRQMARLLDDLLDVSRVTMNRMELRKDLVNLTATIEDAIEASRALIDGKRHQLRVMLPSQPVHLNADPARLAQVFANLLDNAAKYTDPAGSISVSAVLEEAGVWISVKDTGIGIAPEQLPHVFEMFSQAQPALERSRGGLGIGLSLVQALVHMHGGRVEARSAGTFQGSEFRVWLPVDTSDRSRPSSAVAEMVGRESMSTRKVLIVDDNTDAAESLGMYLSLLGHEIQTAHDGLAGVAAAAAFRPDAVLLDIGMPRMNGYEAAQHIRSEPWGKHMLLIAVTGWGQEDDKLRAVQAGFDHHLTKPVDPNAIAALLEDLPSMRE